MRLTFSEFTMALAPRLKFGVYMSIFAVKFLRVKIHISIGGIRISILYDSLNKRHDLGDVFCHPCERIGRTNPQTCHILEELRLPILS